jgi:hypothetical protein
MCNLTVGPAQLPIQGLLGVRSGMKMTTLLHLMLRLHGIVPLHIFSVFTVLCLGTGITSAVPPPPFQFT